MRKAIKMLMLADRTKPRYERDGYGERMPRKGYEPKDRYPEREPMWEGPRQEGYDRMMPRQNGDWDRRRMDDRTDRWDEPRQGYMGFDRDIESRRSRDKNGRFKRARMGMDEYDEDDEDWDKGEPYQQKGRSKVMPVPHKLDEETAEEWMEGLENEDGTKGPHWTMEQTKQFAKQKGMQHDPLEFYVAMNIMYSDYCGIAKKLNVNNVDFYVYMAQAFLDDKDAGEGKLYKYYKHIVE